MAMDLPGILIVDDNEDDRYTLQLLLESDGHERIASAASGNEAIALIEKEKFSLVLLDLMMPDLNGDEVLKVIKSDPDKRDIPVVMISADTDADKVSQCIELGADDYGRKRLWSGQRSSEWTYFSQRCREFISLRTLGSAPDTRTMNPRASRRNVCP